MKFLKFLKSILTNRAADGGESVETIDWNSSPDWGESEIDDLIDELLNQIADGRMATAGDRGTVTAGDRGTATAR